MVVIQKCVEEGPQRPFAMCWNRVPSIFLSTIDCQKSKVSKLVRFFIWGCTTQRFHQASPPREKAICLPFALRIPSLLLHDCGCRNRLQAPGGLSLINETPRCKWLRKGVACVAFICKWWRFGVVLYSSS